MVKMKYDISVCGILRALYLVPIFRSVALSTNLFFVLGTVRVKVSWSPMEEKGSVTEPLNIYYIYRQSTLTEHSQHYGVFTYTDSDCSGDGYLSQKWLQLPYGIGICTEICTHFCAK